MFEKLLNKNNPKIFKQDINATEFLGSPYGEDALRLERDISQRLETVPEVTGAYLSMVKYAGEDQAKLSLLIESSTTKDEFIPALANACAGIIAMDLLFFEDLSEEDSVSLKEKCKQFYTTCNPQ